MGNTISRITKQVASPAKKNSHKPKTVFEVAETVEYHEDVDEAIKRSSWAKAFIQCPAMSDPAGGEAKKDLFSFLVCSCLLSKTNERDKLNILLEQIRTRFFDDGDTYCSKLALKDINDVVQKIFRIFYEDGVSNHMTELKNCMLSLKQDKAIRSALEKPFSLFLNTSRLHPGNEIQNCILCIL